MKPECDRLLRSGLPSDFLRETNGTWEEGALLRFCSRLRDAGFNLSRADIEEVLEVASAHFAATTPARIGSPDDQVRTPTPDSLTTKSRPEFPGAGSTLVGHRNDLGPDQPHQPKARAQENTTEVEQQVTTGPRFGYVAGGAFISVFFAAAWVVPAYQAIVAGESENYMRPVNIVVDLGLFLILLIGIVGTLFGILMMISAFFKEDREKK